MCSPNRAVLLTGRHSHATRVTHNNLDFPEFERSYTEALGDVGYRTGYIDKWHLGPRGMKWKDIGDYDFVPPANRAGFSDWWEGYNSMGAPNLGHMGHTLYDDNGSSRTIRPDECRPIIKTDRAIRKTDEWADGDRPWLMQVNYNPPHPPLVAPDRYQRRYDLDELNPPAERP